MKIKYLIVLFSVLGISLLYCCAQFSKPALVNLHELPEYEGKQVIVQGIVSRYYTTTYGGQLITIQTANSSQPEFSAIVFTESPIEVEYGDIIQASGEVQRYQNQWEITTQTEQDITIVSKWQNISFPFWQLAENPQRYTGINVNITGLIDRVYDTYFYLIDDTEDYCIMVTVDYDEKENISQGNHVNIQGLFTYDIENMRYIIEVTDPSHGIVYYREEKQ